MAQRPAMPVHFAGIGRPKAGKRSQQGRFSGAVGADEADQLARPEFDAQVFEQRFPARPDMKTVGPNCVHRLNFRARM
jgi:hypothetical protein